jgi:pyridoxamine 5'-phosphate oxidase
LSTVTSEVELFTTWLTWAIRAGVREPHAMTLSTIGHDGTPDARVLILKNVDTHGWQFAAHASSPKGRDISAHPVAALTFYWPQQARQIRVRGRVAPEPAERSAADFLARPPGSRAEASLGRQSRPLDRSDELESATKRALARIEADPGFIVPEWTLPVPAAWSRPRRIAARLSGSSSGTSSRAPYPVSQGGSLGFRG